jgi:hypothetical protein
VVQAGGEIVVQNSGGYSAGFTITQSVTIDAAGYNASVINLAGGDLCTINAGPNDRVVLRNISFHGAGLGLSAINVGRVGSLYVEHCSIAEFTGNGVNMLHGGKLFVTGTDMRACSNVGIDIECDGAIPTSLTVHDSRFTESGTGVFFGLSASATIPCAGLLSNCTASECGTGFAAASASNFVKLTLVNCRAFNDSTVLETNGNSGGLVVIQLVYSVVDGETNIAGLQDKILGTNPATNFTGNFTPSGAFNIH